jgi:hypothetical protein
MVLSISNLTLGNTIFDPGANYEGQGLSALKSNQLSGKSLYKYLKNKVFVSIETGPILTLTFDLDPYYTVCWLSIP